MNKHLLFALATMSLCLSGFSQNLNLTLAGSLSYGSEHLSNIWGWTDTADGKEYALVGGADGLSIVDVTNPASPTEIIQIPVPSTSAGCTWREVKTVGDYAYVTTECGDMGLQIIELTNLPATNLAVTTWKPVIGSDTLKTIHALHADNGKIYLYGCNVGNGGAIIADVSTTPMAPKYLGSYDVRYIHDGYVRNDTMYAGHIYDGECAVVVVDTANPNFPKILATFQTPDVFTHNTWLSSDSRYCFTTDEVANSYMAAYDISNLNNIVLTDKVQANPGSGAIVHNTHIIQKNNIDYAITSWYTEGLTITDVSRPKNLVQVGQYDTYPQASGGFNGCWGVYPYFPSGTIVASDINTGLYVFTPNYVRGAFLEGLVLNCADSTPLSNVTVEAVLLNPNSNSNIDQTDFQGHYELGVAVADTYLVVFSKLGFTSDTDTVVLANGIVLNDTFYICPLPTFAYSGKVYDLANNNGIPGANVTIYNSLTSWDTLTDANGNFTIPDMFIGNYAITAGKWGYVTKCIGSQSITPSFPPASIGLPKGIYDDFTFDWNWTVSGNATQGAWVREMPNGTYYQNNVINANQDVSNDCGLMAWVTGNTGTSPSDDDVDSGATVLTSPVFDLSGYTEPYIFFSRWKAFFFGNTDSMKIQLSNGSTVASIENVHLGSVGTGQWVNRNYKISNVISKSSTMRVIVRLVDNGNDDVAEGAFDKFYILDSTNNSVNELTNGVQVTVFPNPIVDQATVVLSGIDQGSGDITFDLFDMTGRIVKTQTANPQIPFTFNRNNLEGGLYIFRIQLGPVLLATGKICVE